MDCFLKLLLFCYSLLVSFVDYHQGLHQVALDKLLTGEDWKLNLLDDSFEMKGLFWVDFLLIEEGNIFLFAANDIRCEGLVAGEEGLSVCVLEDLV